MATKNLGKVAITPRGEWVAGTYEKLDLVSQQGSSYLSRKDGNTSEVTVTADWLKVAEKGNKGDKGDQGNAGWQPLLVADNTAVTGKTLLKLQDWIGGTGTKPTDYVGQWQKGDGTYTSVASEANDIKGASGDGLIASYTPANKIVQPTSYDPATGIFTAPNHGIVNNTNIHSNACVVLSHDGVPFSDYHSILLEGMNYANPAINYRFVNVTANTFQIASVGTNIPIIFTTKTTTNLSKFHFETNFTVDPIITGLNLTSGTIIANIKNVYNSENALAFNNESPYAMGTEARSAANMGHSYVLRFELRGKLLFIDLKGLAFSVSPTGTYSQTPISYTTFRVVDYDVITRIVTAGSRWAKGSTIKIYK